jgi:hypothetical protein
MELTAPQSADFKRLFRGPKGGIRRGANRPNVEEAERAFRRWWHWKRTWWITFGILFGRIKA